MIVIVIIIEPDERTSPFSSTPSFLNSFLQFGPFADTIVTSTPPAAMKRISGIFARPKYDSKNPPEREEEVLLGSTKMSRTLKLITLNNKDVQATGSTEDLNVGFGKKFLMTVCSFSSLYA
jgi:hypothetical protein